jgi:hypothetical protein
MRAVHCALLRSPTAVCNSGCRCLVGAAATTNSGCPAVGLTVIGTTCFCNTVAKRFGAVISLPRSAPASRFWTACPQVEHTRGHWALKPAAFKKPLACQAAQISDQAVSPARLSFVVSACLRPRGTVHCPPLVPTHSVTDEPHSPTCCAFLCRCQHQPRQQDPPHHHPGLAQGLHH